MATSTFENFYKDVLLQRLEEIESLREKVKSLRYAQFVTLGIGALCFIFFQPLLQNSPPVFKAVGILCLVAAIILYFVYRDKNKSYVAAFKQTVIWEIIKFVDPSFKYDFTSCINEKDYKKSGLFLKDPDSYEGDDYVEGKRGSTVFCFSELHTQYKISSGKNTSWHTIFKGIFFIADFNKNFSCRTYVWTEHSPQLNFFTKLFSSFSYDLEKVLLEDPEFERRFIVYSDDQVEARYILSPTLMEKMIALQDMLKKDIVFSFVDTNIYIAIPVGNDIFEPAIFEQPGLEKMKEYYNTMGSMLDIIDELNLNLRIWNKD